MFSRRRGTDRARQRERPLSVPSPHRRAPLESDGHRSEHPGSDFLLRTGPSHFTSVSHSFSASQKEVRMIPTSEPFLGEYLGDIERKLSMR